MEWIGETTAAVVAQFKEGNDRVKSVAILEYMARAVDEGARSVMCESPGIVEDVLGVALGIKEGNLGDIAAALVQTLCLGHPGNKRRCAPLLGKLVELLASAASLPVEPEEQRMTRSARQYAASMAIWSLCYGVPESQGSAFRVSAHSVLAAVIMEENGSKDAAYAATGALWHMSTLANSRAGIAATGVIPKLVEIASQPPLSPIEECKSEHALLACLLLGNIALDETAPSLITEHRVSEALLGFVTSRDATKYPAHTMIWTTVKPLRDLLESPRTSVRCIGCFMAVLLSRQRNETAKLFSDGIVDALKRLPGGDGCNTERTLRDTALSNLGIGKDWELPQVTSRQSDGDGAECLLCCERNGVLKFVPCGHAVACDTCAGIILSRRDPCPVCRSPVTNAVLP